MGIFSSKQTQEEQPNNEIRETEERNQKCILEYEEQLNEIIATEIRRENQRLWLLEQQKQIREEKAQRKKEEQAKRNEQMKQNQKSFIENLTLHQVVKDVVLINALLESFHLQTFKDMPESPFTLQQISVSSKEKEVKNLFRNLNKPLFLVKNTTKIANPFLTLSYNIMKEKARDIENVPIKEKSLYRGIPLELKESVCSINFDKTRDKNERFGSGVIFAKDVSVAAQQFTGDSQLKVLVLTKVFFGDIRECDATIKVPEEPSYITTNHDKSVFVKYDDASYLPVYLVEYEEFQKQRSQRSKQL